MGDTTLTLDEATKERLENYRGDGHYSWDEFHQGIMEILPTVDDVQEGCVRCGESPLWQGTIEETGGVIQFFHATFEGSDVYGTSYFCSPECAAKAQEEVDKQVPQEPDEVLVGGDEMPRGTVEGARYYIDRRTQEVMVPMPGAFAGTSSHGTEYEYVGEPVYLRNEGEIVQHGVVEEIIHEDARTVLLLEKDIPTEMLNHPDEQRREEYKERHAESETGLCPECEAELTVWETGEDEDDPQCPECETFVTAETLLDVEE